MAFIYDDNVPPCQAEVIAVLQIGFQRVHRNDGPVEVVEGVVIRRNQVPNALQSHRVESNERNGKSRPPFLLELREHALLGDHKDALAAPALDELRGEDAGF